mgnify:CR=1 FL=1
MVRRRGKRDWCFPWINRSGTCGAVFCAWAGPTATRRFPFAAYTLLAWISAASLGNVGVGYAYLVGANQEVDREQIAEIYYRFVMTDNLAFTADLQYLDEVRKNGESPRGWVFGLRAVADF